MPESGTTGSNASQASFAEHVRAFHQSLPREEQELLEQLFALAQAGQGDVQGFAQVDFFSLQPADGGAPAAFQWGVGRGISGGGGAGKV